jgi:hypothetical protein
MPYYTHIDIIVQPKLSCARRQGVAAAVARSTFYAHYSSKLALLRHMLHLVLEPLADAVDTRRPSNKSLAQAEAIDNAQAPLGASLARPLLQAQAALAVRSR